MHPGQVNSLKLFMSHRVFNHFIGICITPAHRKELKDVMCKRRGNHVSSIVNKFFYAANDTADQYPSKKHPDYGFRPVHIKEINKDASEEVRDVCNFNRANAAKLLKDCKFFTENVSSISFVFRVLSYVLCMIGNPTPCHAGDPQIPLFRGFPEKKYAPG